MRPPIALIALGLLAAPAAAQLSEPHVVRPSATPCLNVRPDHDTDTEPDTGIPPGTAVTVIASVPYWREIRLDDGSTGWAAKKFLEPVTVAAPPEGEVALPDDASTSWTWGKETPSGSAPTTTAWMETGSSRAATS